MTVTDANNCSTTATATVTEPSELTASVEDTALACFGDDNGELTVVANGGTTDYSYAWSNGDATAAITGLTAGTYTVTVTDANNCSTTATATVSEPSELTASVSDHDLACFGDDNGELTATAQGGTTDYSYVWSNGDATAAITGLTAGTYTVTVTDANNCSTTATAIVTEPSELTASAEDAELACFGDDNGELTVVANGGTTDYSYVWSNGDATAAITGLTAGTYTVTVTDANNCSTTATATVSEPSELTASVSDHDLACFGDDNGELSAIANGGTTDYSYAWSNGDATAAITGLTAGTYTVTVTDANNCSTTATAIVTEPSELTASAEDAELACFGDDNGELTVVANGGTTDYSYVWSNGDATAAITGLTAGTYTVTVTDANNCSTTATAIVTEPSELTASVSDHDLACFGDDNGELSAIANGGTTDYSYAWSNGDATAAITGLTAGTYTVTVTDANNCSTTATAIVTEPSELTASAEDAELACFGDDNGELTVVANGGTTDYSYVWSNGDATAAITGLTAGTYTVTVTDANNCSTTATATVTEPSELTASVEDTALACFGDDNGELTVVANGGTTDYSYVWSNGDATAAITGLTAGTYTVTVTDANNCSTTATATVSEPSELTASVEDAALACFGDDNGELTATAQGGTTDYSYAWSNGDATAAITGLTAGTYTVTVTDANNCSTTATATVTEPEGIEMSIAATHLDCSNDDDGTAEVTATGGTGSLTYVWSNGETGAAIDGLILGNYTVTVTDENNCSATEQVAITSASDCSSLGDFVWLDVNGNGVQDDVAIEEGIEGVKVVLYEANGTFVAETTTDENGFYLFDDLQSGTYYVVFTAPDGLIATSANQGDDTKDSDAKTTTGQTDDIVLGVGEFNETIDAGYYEPVNLGDFVWLDLNSDGDFDEGETPLAGIPVKLFDADGNIVSSTTTDENGIYGFDNLPPGTYTVSVPNFGPDGEELTTDNHQTTTLLSGEEDLTLDFGYGAIVNSLGDFVWLDENGNGSQGGNEEGIEGVTVTLYNANTDEELAITTTDEDGYYLFTGLLDGNYYVVFGDVANMVRTDRDAGGNDGNDSDADENGKSHTVKLSGGEENLSIDAGYLPLARLGDFVWLDLDKDGNQDEGEPGIEGVTVTLLDENGDEIATTTTDENGLYSFEGLMPGTYTVFVAANGPNGETPTTGTSQTTTLTAGQQDLTLDFGYAPLLNSLGDFVWLDENKNGTQGGNEEGIEGVTVTLYNADTDEELATTSTDENGFYLFTELPDGNYYVVFEGIDSMERTEADKGGNDAKDSDADENGQSHTVTLEGGDNDLTIDAGYYFVTNLGDFVWLDVDRDGIQDEGEQGIEGVTVTLYNATNNQALDATTTDENGFYLFEDLDAGEYYIVFGEVQGYLLSPANEGGNDAKDSDADENGQSQTVTLALGNSDLTIDAGFFPACTLVLVSEVSDCFYNENTGSSKATVTVTVNWTNAVFGDNVVVNVGSNSQTWSTGDGSGSIDFEFLVPANGNFGNITASIGEFCSEDSFFEAPAPCEVVNSLGDFVWLDENGNGIQDVGEEGIEGVQVTLFNADTNGSITSSTTDESGFYLFDNLPDGNYFVVFGDVEDFNRTTANEGDNDATDSDAGTNGQTASVTLEGGESDLTFDAGYYAPVTIGNYVWLDLNGDGVQDDEENGLGGITVTLLDADGNVVATTTTNGNGIYTFNNLPPGTYTVSVPAIGNNGETPSTPTTITHTLTSGETNLTYDFGYTPLLNGLGDFVWLDDNGNGLQDAGERGIEGVTVTLYNADTDEQLATTSTDEDGAYSFNGLLDGSYYVVFGDANGLDRTSANEGDNEAADSDANQNGQSHTVDLAAGDFNRDVDAGYYAPVTIGDYVWLDENGNGQQGGNEVGLGGVTLTLFNEDGAVVATTTSDENGFYSFTNLAPGTYTVSVSILGPNGETITTASSMTTTLLSGESDLDLDFGYQTIAEPLGAIGDFVWIDQNGNGVQDAGDTGIAGVEVELFNADTGASMGTTTTGTLGDYLFTGLAAGNYYVQFDLPTGYQTSPQFATADFRADSNADENGTSDTIALGEGEQNFTIDAGIYLPVQLGDFVWNDMNGDGVQDAGEQGIEGVTVVLLGENGNVLATIDTDENGFYLFDNLAPGTYSTLVPPLLPTGEEPTTFIQMTTTLESGESDLDLDFGYWIPPVNGLGDYVWLDENANGIQDEGEPGLQDIIVNIYDANTGELVNSTLTDENGFYWFGGLANGSYYIVIDKISGTLQVTEQNEGGDETNDSDIDNTLTSDVVTLEGGIDYPDLDAGLFELAGLGGTVWLDLNGDGVMDLNEVGIEGVPVTLLDADGNIFATTTTDPDGNYTFSGLVPGEYTVMVPEFGPNGETLTTPMELTTVLFSGDYVGNLDFGYEPVDGVSSLGGLTWLDLDGDGVKDANEDILGGIEVTLLDGNGNVIASTITNPDGTYIFVGLNSGNYSVQAETTGPNGETITTPIVLVTELGYNEHIDGLDFGYQPSDGLGAIGDLVWYDTDGDGVKDPSEVGIAGVTVTLTLPDGTSITTTTNVTGYYLFDELPAGNYVVTVGAGPLGTTITTVNSFNVNLGEGDQYLIADFGFMPEEELLGAIGDLVWFDIDGDGDLDSFEIGIGGVTVTIYDAGGHPIRTVITNLDGYYLFEDLPEGEYTVIVDETTAPVGLIPSTPITVTYNLASGEIYLDADFGFTIDGGGSPAEYCTGQLTTIELCVNLEAGEILLPDATHTLFDCSIQSSSSNCVEYTPLPGFEGNEIVTLTICNENDLTDCHQEVFLIAVGCLPPNAVNDVASIAPTSTMFNGSVTNTTSGYDGISVNVWANDYDMCYDGWTTAITSNPANGTATISTNGIIDYVPNEGFEGVDQLTYQICNECGSCNTAVVTIDVTLPDNPCETEDFNICVKPITPIEICPDFCLDGEYEITSAKTTYNCSISVADQCITYTALPLFAGNDVVEIIACTLDGTVCDTSYVYITVSNDCSDVNNPPIAVDDSAVSPLGNTIAIAVMDNDSDPDGDTFTITAFTEPSSGVVVLNGNLFEYTPLPGYVGEDSFTYQICDSHGACDEATVTIEVTGKSCKDTLYLCAEPLQPLVICPEFCGLPNSDNITITSANTTYSCSLQMLDDGCIQYTALPLFAGQEIITIVGCNAFGQCDTSYAVIQVTGCNDDGPGKSISTPFSTTENVEETLTELTINSILPVPAKDFVTINFTMIPGDATIEVYGMTGQRMSVNELSSANMQNMIRLDVMDYPVGVYVVKIQAGDEVISSKFIKR
ncbi:MAG: SdrD B-like domain-containing protein [Chitinophagales bacterium]